MRVFLRNSDNTTESEKSMKAKLAKAAIKKTAKAGRQKVAGKQTVKTIITRGKENAMSDVQLEKLTSADLKELLTKVDALIASKQVAERSSLKEKFQEMAEAAGYTLSEIVGGSAGGGRSSVKGRTVAAKFANPANPKEKWSGRGRQPLWLVAKLKSGASLEDFRL